MSNPNLEQPLSSLTCGVAMCTCNGIAYLAEQLASLLAQEYCPDQIAIFDDASEDGTWELLLEWAKKQTIQINLHQNRPRLGLVKNFEAVVQALDTDLIFLCDQDDIWLPSKIRILRDKFISDPAVTLIHTDARLVDAQGADLNASLFDALGLTDRERSQVASGDALDVLCRRNIVTGATAGFRRELLHLAIPFSLHWVHDEWLAILASVSGGLVLEDRSTILYRQHGGNAIGMLAPGVARTINRFKIVLTLPARKFQLMRLQRVDDLYTRLSQRDVLPASRDPMLREWRGFSLFSATLPANVLVRTLIVLKRLLSGNQYYRFGRGGLSALRDIFNR